jgi:hypothetical protein
MRLQEQMANARMSRSKSTKRMSKEEVEQHLMSPVQEKAFHQLFAMEEYIDEILGKMRKCPATKEGLCDLMSDTRVVRLLSEMSTTEQMLAFLVKDSLVTGSKKSSTTKNSNDEKNLSSSSNESTSQALSKS